MNLVWTEFKSPYWSLIYGPSKTLAYCNLLQNPSPIVSKIAPNL
jgi:hypothetical protein